MTYTNKNNLPDFIVRALTGWDSKYSMGGADFSVTGLMKPAHQAALQRAHRGELQEDVSDLFYKVWGTVAHSVFEDAHNDALQECRFFWKSESGATVSGQADIITADGWLLDIKTTSANGLSAGDILCQCVGTDTQYKVKKDWILQVNMYMYLSRHGQGQKYVEGYDEPEIIQHDKVPKVDHLGIVVVIRDWNQYRATYSYPHAPCLQIEVPMMTDDEVRQYMEDRIAAHKEPGTDCSEEERWVRRASWTLEVGGKPWNRGKRFYSIEAAEEQAFRLGEATIIEKPGTSARCENYCSVSCFCEAHKKRKEAMNAKSKS